MNGMLELIKIYKKIEMLLVISYYGTTKTKT